jgi:hypothetical protein
MLSSDEKGYSKPLIDWKNADDKGNITFRHQVSESFLRNYILHYNYRNQNFKTDEGYTDASFYLKRYIRGMVNEDDVGNNVWGLTKNNILPVNGYMEMGKEVKKSWDRIERIDLKYEISDTYSDIDNQALLDYLEVCTIYEEQSQLVCNLILEILADIHKQFHIDSTNSWFEFNRDDSYGWGNFLDDWVKLTFTKWSSEKGHIDWTTTWDDFANVVNKAPEPIHSFVNLVFSIIKLSVFSVLFPPISALALISYSYEMLSMKSFGAKAKSFNLLMQDLLDLYLAKEGYQVKTFHNEIKRHENQSSDGYLQYDPIVGKTNFEYFNYAWKVSPLTFPHKPFEYSNYEIIFGFEQLHDFKNKLTHAGVKIEKYQKQFNDAKYEKPEIYPHDIFSNKRKYWQHITTQLISLFELIGKRNQKPVLAIPQPNGKVKIYSWDETSLHYNATQKAPSDGHKDWRWAGYEIKPKESTYGFGYGRAYKTKPKKWSAEDDDKTYNTNPEITLALKHQEIEASQYDLIRYCPNALQAWQKIPRPSYIQTFGKVQGDRVYNQIAEYELNQWIHAEPLLVIGNEYLTEETEMNDSELLKYIGLLFTRQGGNPSPAYIFNEDKESDYGNNAKAYTFNRENLRPNHTHYKLLEMVNLHPNYLRPEEGDKVFSRAIGKDNSILNIPIYNSNPDTRVSFTTLDGQQTNPIQYPMFRNKLVLNGSIDENDFISDEYDWINYSLRKSLEIGRINGEGWRKDWTNMFYPNTTVINVLGRKPAGFINWYINPTLDVMTQDDYGKSDSTVLKQDEPPSKGEVKMPIQAHPDDELIVEDDAAQLADEILEEGYRGYYGYGENLIRPRPEQRQAAGWNDEDDRRFERLMRERRRNNPDGN